MTGVKRFPFNNFTHCLTLFSKFFSSFPHGTCSLSVSHPYLALDEIYNPFRASIPGNPTRRTNRHIQANESQTGLSPSMASFSKEICPVARTRGNVSRLQFGR